MRLTLPAALAAFLLLLAPAQAAPVAFGGGPDGTDPLGHEWTTSDLGWGIPGVLQGATLFNPAGPAGFAPVALTFTVLGGVAGGLDAATSVLENLIDGSLWMAVVDGLSVTFTAPGGAALAQDDIFYVNVGFLGGYDPAAFRFEAAWLPAPAAVPAPAALALFGLAALGLLLVRRRA